MATIQEEEIPVYTKDQSYKYLIIYQIRVYNVCEQTEQLIETFNPFLPNALPNASALSPSVLPSAPRSAVCYHVVYVDS